jgi:hypothetical protein
MGNDAIRFGALERAVGFPVEGVAAAGSEQAQTIGSPATRTLGGVSIRECLTEARDVDMIRHIYDPTVPLAIKSLDVPVGVTVAGVRGRINVGVRNTLASASHTSRHDTTVF